MHRAGCRPDVPSRTCPDVPGRAGTRRDVSQTWARGVRSCSEVLARFRKCPGVSGGVRAFPDVPGRARACPEVSGLDRTHPDVSGRGWACRDVTGHAGTSRTFVEDRQRPLNVLGLTGRCLDMCGRNCVDGRGATVLLRVRRQAADACAGLVAPAAALAAPLAAPAAAVDRPVSHPAPAAPP
eukprot:4093755-Alexandrium_andersonii.AAC.1